jgi:hypothetical protein
MATFIFMLPNIASMTDAYHHAQLLKVEMQSLGLFALVDLKP